MKLLPISFLLMWLGFGPGASDYPIDERADSIHPRQESLVLTSLRERASRGSNRLKVVSASSVDPRQWLLIRSDDGVYQETHCIKSVDERRKEIKLAEDLRRDFAFGSDLIQGSVARERGIVAKLAEDADGGDSVLTLDATREIDALEQVILQSVDGRVREAHCVKSVAGMRVELADDLRNDFKKEAAVIQGRLIEGVSEGDNNPCCCPGKRAGRR